MENLLKVIPLALLILIAAIVIFRGLRKTTHDKGDIRGGGSGDDSGRF